MRMLFVLFLLLPLPALAGKNAITGRVLDRNGGPVDRAIVTLTPGNVSLVTDREGNFLIDYLRDDAGERIRLGSRTTYALEIYKVGFHVEKKEFFYKKGPIEVDALTLVEETIEVHDDGQDLDPALYKNPTQSSGAAYEDQ